MSVNKKILEYLEKEGMVEVDEIEYNSNITVYNFFYPFDEAELEAAKEYANENYDEAEGEEGWNENYFLPYLTEIAADNIRDILEDVSSEFEVTGEFVVYELEANRPEKCEFTIAVAKEVVEFDIEKIMDELEL